MTPEKLISTRSNLPLEKNNIQNQHNIIEMKKLISIIILSAFIFSARAQQFAQYLSTAKSSYSAGKLEDARFAMEQMLQEIDMITGKEIVKILPQKMGDNLPANTAKDNVSVATGFYGVIIDREYGQPSNASGNTNSNTGTNPAGTGASLQIITNSPMIATLNTLLSVPIIGGMGGNNKIIKINGYKALVQKSENGTTADYEVELPLNSTLITFKAPGFSMDDVIKMANTIPVSDIAKLVQ